MRIEKENQFLPFSKLLTKIDTGNFGDYEIKVLKQEHDYLDRLRHQRMKIQQLKHKYDDTEALLNQQRDHNHQLNQLVEEKSQIIQSLQHQLHVEIGKRQNLEKALQRQTQTDKGRSKTRLKQLEHQNQELKRILRQKQLTIISMDEQFTEKLKKYKESFQVQKRALLIDLDEKLNEAKSKNTDNQVLELKNLIQRQNKTLKMQNQKFQQASQRNQILIAQIQELKQLIQKKDSQMEDYQNKIGQLSQQLEIMHVKFEKEGHNNKVKGQLEQIKRRMAQMQKSEIQRIEFIVNQMQ